MQIWRGLADVPHGWGRSAVTIGVFDGVHRGHQQTIEQMVKRARDLGIASVVVTFDPHPAEVVRPGSHPAVLTSPTRKAELIDDLGVDALCVIPFTPEFSQLPAERFVHDVLVEHLHAAVVVVGDNFRFGHRSAGDVALLTQLGRTFGFAVTGAPLVSADDTVFSSTYIRSCVDAGEVGAAATALGRPHRIEGIVVRGDQRGRELGFPTANVLCDPHTAVPADGIYAAWVPRPGERRPGERQPGERGSGEPRSGARWRGEPSRAAVSIGTNPTFGGRGRRIEAYLLDFDGDLYGERLAIDFVAYLRPMRRYDGVGPLVAQIKQDVTDTRAVLSGAVGPEVTGTG